MCDNVAEQNSVSGCLVMGNDRAGSVVTSKDVRLCPFETV